MTKEKWVTEFVAVLCHELRPDLGRGDARELAIRQWRDLREKNPRQSALDWSVSHSIGSAAKDN